MKNRTIHLAAVLGMAVSAQLLLFSPAEAAKGRGNNDMLGTVYVSGQGLYYDTFKTTDLPPVGVFQKLDPGAPNGPTTPYGPGDKEYVGGRWWVDTNNDDIMDELDLYFSCPLLGPGRTEP